MAREGAQDHHTGEGDVLALAHAYSARGHTQAPRASASQMHRDAHGNTQRSGCTHVGTAQHCHMFAPRLQNAGPGEREGMRWPELHFSEALLSAGDPHSQLLHDSGLQGPVLSGCELCTSRGWHPAAAHTGKGASPTPAWKGRWAACRPMRRVPGAALAAPRARVDLIWAVSSSSEAR